MLWLSFYHYGNCEEELPKKPVGRQSTNRLRKNNSTDFTYLPIDGKVGSM